MARIIITENATLDGVVQDPMGEEGFGFGGWGARLGDNDRKEWARVLLDEALGTEALLLGRKSEEWFAARWESRSGAWADRLNSMPKFVVSATRSEPRWSNSTVLGSDVLTEVSKLKEELAGDIVVYASAQLGHTLFEHDHVDEVRLIIYPVVAGAGVRVFGESGEQKPLRLVDARALGDSLAFLTYQVVRDA
jgi:dihydrofolate reductase